MAHSNINVASNHNSVQTRGVVKASGFTRGVGKINDFMKFKDFPVEFLENRRF